MNLSHRVLLAIIVAILSACVSSKPLLENSRNYLEAKENNAREVYNAGSSFAGDGSSLLFINDTQWEQWSMSCTDVDKIASGTYSRNHGRIILHEKDEPSVILYSFRFDHKKLLVTKEELQLIKKDPDNIVIQSLFKKVK